MTADGSVVLYCLRRAMAEIEGGNLCGFKEGRHVLALGVGAIDATLGGGLACGAVHELAPSASLHVGAAIGFALALAVRGGGGRQTLWIQSEFAGHEAGLLYGPGLALSGLALERLIIVRVARPLDVLWAMEEALKCRALALVIAELADDSAATGLTTSRRLAVAAGAGGGLGLLLRHRASAAASAAMTRWEIAAATGRCDVFGGLGPATFILSLIKNRRGPTGRWIVAWDQHEHAFSPLSVGLAQSACDRPDRAPLARAG